MYDSHEWHVLMSPCLIVSVANASASWSSKSVLSQVIRTFFRAKIMTFHSNSELLQLIQNLEAYDDWVFVEQYHEQQLETEWYIEYRNRIAKL